MNQINKETIDCEISTPQFHGSQDKFHMHTQRGVYDKTTMLFTPYKNIFGTYSCGDHGVQFSSEEEFRKFLVRKVKTNGPNGRSRWDFIRDNLYMICYLLMILIVFALLLYTKFHN